MKVEFLYISSLVSFCCFSFSRSAWAQLSSCEIANFEVFQVGLGFYSMHRTHFLTP